VNDQSDIRLGRHFQVFIEDQLAAGHYGSATAVLEEGLRLLERREARLVALDQALIDGEESGPATPLDMEEIKAKARERARASHAA
jgi:antitoxin ParD1/3/4